MYSNYHSHQTLPGLILDDDSSHCTGSFLLIYYHPISALLSDAAQIDEKKAIRYTRGLSINIIIHTRPPLYIRIQPDYLAIFVYIRGARTEWGLGAVRVWGLTQAFHQW